MESSQSLTRAVREEALGLGFDLVGFARAEPFAKEQELILEDLARGHMDGMAWITAERIRLACDPSALLPGAQTIVGLGTSYGPAMPSASTKANSARRRGRVARYAWGRDYHDVIGKRLRPLAGTITRLAGPGTRCRIFVDTGPLVERAAAERAGLGFVGKNACVLTGRYGSYVLLSAIITTAALEPDPFIARDCGSCRACLDACPTDAFVEAGRLDARRCISYLTIEHRGFIPGELRPLMGDWVFGCDVCQEVCPWNRARASAHHPELSAAAGVGESLDLIELLATDEAAFRNRFRGTPLTRPKRGGLLRNAAVALGNSGGRAAIPALTAALDDADALVRGHAAWALSRIGDLPSETVQSLERARAIEEDQEVRWELEDALSLLAKRSV
jgi:epoxyqueuosine reductase